MSVNVDETRYQHRFAPIDLGIGRSRVVFAKVSNSVAREGQVGIPMIDMNSSQCVPADDPRRIPDASGAGHAYLRPSLCDVSPRVFSRGEKLASRLGVPQ
jgi:hypothetical protein